MTLLEFAGQIGGIAGVLAVIMFLVYRQDRKSSEKQLLDVLHGYRDDCKNQTEAFGKVREALVELTTWLKRKNGDG